MSHLNTFPTEILTQILESCTWKSLLSTRQVNRRLRDISTLLAFRTVRLNHDFPDGIARVNGLIEPAKPAALASHIRNLVIDQKIAFDDDFKPDGIKWEELLELCGPRLSDLTIVALKVCPQTGVTCWEGDPENYAAQFAARMMHRLGRIFSNNPGMTAQLRRLEIRTDQAEYIMQMFHPWLKLSWTDRDKFASVNSATQPLFGNLDKLEVVVTVRGRVMNRGVIYTPGCVRLLANGCLNLKNLRVSIAPPETGQPTLTPLELPHGSTLLCFGGCNPLSIETVYLDANVSLDSADPLINALEPLKNVRGLTLKKIRVVNGWLRVFAQMRDGMLRLLSYELLGIANGDGTHWWWDTSGYLCSASYEENRLLESLKDTVEERRVRCGLSRRW